MMNMIRRTFFSGISYARNTYICHYWWKWIVFYRSSLFYGTFPICQKRVQFSRVIVENDFWSPYHITLYTHHTTRTHTYTLAYYSHKRLKDLGDVVGTKKTEVKMIMMMPSAETIWEHKVKEEGYWIACKSKIASTI